MSRMSDGVMVRSRNGGKRHCHTVPWHGVAMGNAPAGRAPVHSSFSTNPWPYTVWMSFLSYALSMELRR